MLKRLIALVFIFCSASLAWMILGATLLARTNQSDINQREKLAAQWGADETQTAPQIVALSNSRKEIAVPIAGSRVDVNVILEQRREGLLWYNLYDVRFHARYRVVNDTPNRRLMVRFGLPSADATYANFRLAIGAQSVNASTAVNQGFAFFDLAPGHAATIDVGYASRLPGVTSFGSPPSARITNRCCRLSSTYESQWR